MTDRNKDKKNKSPDPRDGLNARDRALWAHMMRDVDPLPDTGDGRFSTRQGGTADRVAGQGNRSASGPEAQRSGPAGVQLPALSQGQNGAGMPAPHPRTDRRTHEKLRKGRIAIEARIDLHGMSQDRARSALAHFIRTRQASGCRCVLVITGKGRGARSGHHEPAEQDWTAPRPGVLRRMVPEWLHAPALRPYVLEIAQARPRDGGEGAFYVLLRKKR